MLKSVLLFTGLAALPALGFAQSTAEESGFYVGADISILTDKPFSGYGSTLVGPAVTGGMRFTPHLALQLSAAYSWKNTTNAYSYYDSGSTIPSVYSTDTNLKVYSFPLLLRGTLTSPQSRVHADVLGGVMYLHSSSHEQYTYTFNGRLNSQREYDSSIDRVNLTLGPAIRYSFTPRWELAADALVNYYFSDATASFSDHLFLNILAGVHYSF